MSIGTSAICQRMEEGKKKRQEERNERSTDVTGNLVNVDYRGCFAACRPALALSLSLSLRPANDINLTS